MPQTRYTRICSLMHIAGGVWLTKNDSSSKTDGDGPRGHRRARRGTFMDGARRRRLGQDRRGRTSCETRCAPGGNGPPRGGPAAADADRSSVPNQGFGRHHGTMMAGRLRVDDSSEVFPAGVQASARSAGPGHAVDSRAPSRTAVNLKRGSVSLSSRQLLGLAGTWCPRRTGGRNDRAVADAPRPLKTSDRPRTHRAQRDLARVILLDRQEMAQESRRSRACGGGPPGGRCGRRFVIALLAMVTIGGNDTTSRRRGSSESDRAHAHLPPREDRRGCRGARQQRPAAAAAGWHAGGPGALRPQRLRSLLDR